MGFFDSMKKTFEEESRKAENRKAHSNYKTLLQLDNERYDTFNGQNDGSLLGKFNSPFTSDEDKKVISRILESRGYSKHKNGTYGRR